MMFNTETGWKYSFKTTQRKNEWWDNGVLPLWITAQRQVPWARAGPALSLLATGCGRRRLPPLAGRVDSFRRAGGQGGGGEKSRAAEAVPAASHPSPEGQPPGLGQTRGHWQRGAERPFRAPRVSGTWVCGDRPRPAGKGHGHQEAGLLADGLTQEPEHAEPGAPTAPQAGLGGKHLTAQGHRGRSSARVSGRPSSTEKQ